MAYSDPQSLVAFLVLLSLAATVPVALAVLWAYQKAVRRAMKQRAGTDLQPPTLTEPAAVPGPPHIDLARGMPDAALPATYHQALRCPRRLAVAYAVAGVAHVVVSTALLFFLNGMEVDPLRVLVVGAVLAWPVALTAITVAVPGRRWKGLGVAVYVAVLLLVAGPYTREALWLLAYYGGIPTLALLLMANPWLRTAGPFVAVVLLGAATGWLVSVDARYWAIVTDVVQTGEQVRVVGWIVGALGLGLGALALRRIARAYERRRWSDQMLYVSAWWLLYTVWLSVTLMSSSGWLGTLGLVPFGVYLVALRVALARVRPEAGRPVRLLILRVFGSRRRSERLFREVGLHWRTVGGIGLISAPDLAAETMEPHELLTFLSGRLRRLFVRTRADLDRQAAALDDGPDPDGRYRVTELMCHDDTWRAAVARLVDATEAVLVDLRGFAPRNRGIQYELRLLLSTVPVRRLVLVTDATSDAAALEATLREAWDQMADDAPNRDASPAVVLYDLGRQGRRDIRGLLARLTVAAYTETAASQLV